MKEEDVPYEYWLLVLKKTSRSPASLQFFIIKQRLRSPKSNSRWFELNTFIDGVLVVIPLLLKGDPLIGEAFVIWNKSGLFFIFCDVTLLLNSSTL